VATSGDRADSLVTRAREGLTSGARLLEGERSRAGGVLRLTSGVGRSAGGEARRKRERARGRWAAWAAREGGGARVREGGEVGWIRPSRGGDFPFFFFYFFLYFYFYFSFSLISFFF
jgi:hypothetical protein